MTEDKTELSLRKNTDTSPVPYQTAGTLAQPLMTKEQWRADMQKFANAMNAEPDPKSIRKHPMSNTPYLPIDHIEGLLDSYFQGMWETELIEQWQVANEQCMLLYLKVFCPVSGIWLRRVGAGAAPIQLKKGASATDLSAKQHNAMQLGLPAAKAMALSNAAKSLGKLFGRSVGRKQDQISAFKPVFTSTTDDEYFENCKKQILQAVEAAKVQEILGRAMTRLDADKFEALQTFAGEQGRIQ